MARIEEIIAQMRQNAKGIRFRDLCRVYDFFFGKARQQRSSHRVYKTPWQEDPRVNTQNDKGMVKAYQVKQVLRAIERLEAQNDTQR